MKETSGDREMTAFETTRKLCEVVLDEYMGGKAKVVSYVKQDSEIHITYENKRDWFPTGKAIVNIYQYGVYLKEIIENKAHSIGLKATWIDLNDLSKDEGYYFRHCNEVYEDLLKYEGLVK